MISHTLRFWYFLCCDALSLTCAIYTLYVLLSNRILRRALNNHIFIVILFIVILYEMINIPFFLRNTFYDTPWLTSKDVYLFWTFFDYLLFVLQIELFAWATLERHILIFHDQWLITKRNRFLLHYLPIIIIIICNIIFYIVVYYGVPCDTSFDDFLRGSIYIPCIFYQTILGSFDLFVQQIIPTLIMIIASFTLIVRVAKQKARAQQMFRWKKYRKLTIQSISISAICILFNSPWIFTTLAFQCGAPLHVVLPILIYSNFIYYNITFCFPFVCYLTLPELRKKLKISIWHSRHRRQQIGPTQNRMNTERT